MPLQATSGAASYDAFGGGAVAAIPYIEDVFSTYLYTGNGSTQTITNGIDLAGKGGLVWTKGRDANYFHGLTDTTRGAGKLIYSNATLAQAGPSAGNDLTSFNSNGFSLGPDTNVNINTDTKLFVSWTFRKQPKFFDIVTWTGDSNNSRMLSHSLGSVPACIITKCTSTTSNWMTWHIASGITTSVTGFQLNGTAAATTTGYDVSTDITSTQFRPAAIFDSASNEPNVSGRTYVAYLFAHNAGGFGLTGTDNVISCGSYTATGNDTINLGYEPQWILEKRVSSADDDWELTDNMRGFSMTDFKVLNPNRSAAETSYGAFRQPTATGYINKYWGSGTIIYIAIRRGPMKVPTSGTSVFAPIAATASTNTSRTVGFPSDMTLSTIRTISDQRLMVDRLRGYANTNSATPPTLDTTSTAAEVVNTSATIYNVWNTTALDGPYSNTYSTVWWHFRRAPSFFDVVCYTGTDVARTVTHNLGVAPELMIVKGRNIAASWRVYSAPTTALKHLLLNAEDFAVVDGMWNDTAPTSSVFTVGTSAAVNGSGYTYVAYLFSTCAGVSKVGSYTGTGTTKQIDCGFTGGARFVLIKRTDLEGSWYVWDSARGIVSGNDPYLLLNTTDAEVTNTDYIDTYSAGFEISSTAPSAINASGGTFIFLAIA
jgi:hypothetical protein